MTDREQKQMMNELYDETGDSCGSNLDAIEKRYVEVFGEQALHELKERLYALTAR